MKKNIVLLVSCMSCFFASYAYSCESFEDAVEFLSSGVSATKDGIIFPEYKNLCDSEIAYRADFIKFLIQYSESLGLQGRLEEKRAVDGWTRDMLILQMQVHKQWHDKNIEKAEKLLSIHHLLDGAGEALFRAAQSSVTTYSGGGRNYLLPLVVEIIVWTSQKCIQSYNIWCEYDGYIKEAKYNAEMFDFYMSTLKKIYGQ